jgi:hypothetical protein
MTNLISRTFINEIDISKIKADMPVKIGIDAFPDKELEGKVISIANVGQNMPNSDAKVFEVKVKIFGEDGDLRPAMTTSNIVRAMTLQDTLFVPMESIFANDSLQFVYKLHGKKPVKQIVALGDANENFVLIKDGLKEGDEIFLSTPDETKGLVYEGLEIYAQILKEKEEKEAAEEKAKKEFEEKAKKPQLPPGVTPEMMKAMQAKPIAKSN